MGTKYLPTLEPKYPDNALIALLTELSWAIMNYDKRFPSKSTDVHVISPAFNTFIGFKIIDNEACLGVQDPTYGKMYHIPWKLVTVLPGSPGLYLSYATNAPPPYHYGVLRFYARASFTKLMGHFDYLKICRMDATGEDLSWMDGGAFHLPIKKVPKPDWT